MRTKDRTELEKDPWIYKKDNMLDKDNCTVQGVHGYMFKF